MLDYFYLGVYRFFSFVVWVLPEYFVRAVLRGLAWSAYALSKRRRSIIHDNLDLAFESSLSEAEKKEIGIGAYMNLIDTTFGLMKRDRMNIDEVMENITFEGAEIVEKYQREGKKFMFISGHYGNWELVAPAIAQRFNMTFVVVGRKLDSEVMDTVLKESREKFNVELVYKKGALRGCISAINQGKTIGVLTDQSIHKSLSTDVIFFAHKATHTPMASILSRKFEMDVIPIYISTENYVDYCIKICKPIEMIKTDNQEEDLAILTQLQSDVMEENIRQNPKQWFWMHKRWKGFNK